MLLKRKYLSAALLVAIALAAGHYVQSTSEPRPAPGIETSRIETGAVPPAPEPAPAPPAAEPRAADAIARTPMPEPAPKEAAASLACDADLSATRAPGAMVHLTLAAPCAPNTAVTVQHAGLTLAASTGPSGQLALRVPAMATPARFVLRLGAQELEPVSVEVPTLPAYDRVALIWPAPGAFGIRATEPGREHPTTAHHPGTPRAATQAQGGFLVALDLAGDARAEIYSYPSQRAQRSGVVRLDIEARVTAANCGTTARMDRLMVRATGTPERLPVTIRLPDCEAVGDTLVLKNLLRDLRLARN